MTTATTASPYKYSVALPDGSVKFIQGKYFLTSGFTPAYAPLASELVTIVNAVDMANGVQVIALATPKVPCKLNIRIVDGDSSVSAGTVTLVYTDQNGVSHSDVFSLAGGTRTLLSTYAAVTVTSVTIAGLVGAVGGDTIGVGQSAHLALIGAPNGANYTVYSAKVGATILVLAADTIGTVDAVAGTILPNVAPDGSKVFGFYYTFSASP